MFLGNKRSIAKWSKAINCKFIEISSKVRILLLLYLYIIFIMLLQKKYNNYLLKILPIYSFNTVKDNNLILTVPLKKKNNILFFLKKHSNTRFDILTDIIGIDYPNKKKRFKIIYNLLSILYNVRLYIQISVNEKQSVQTITNIYKNSNWFEREVWDMFGIFFFKHPDLRRILTDYGFEGFPLRKDFPVIGFLEVQYSEIEKNIIYSSLNISKKYYNFNFENSWIKNV